VNPPKLLLLLFLAVLPAQAGLVNRWSFNQGAAPAPTGTVFTDSISSVPMIVRGVGATLDGTRVVLPGTTTSGQPNSTISAYLDLPNGLVSSKTNITVEIWAAPISVQNWQPLFEFGRLDTAGDGLGAPGEWTGNAVGGPGSTQGSDLLGCSMNQGVNINQQYQVVMIDGGFQSAISSNLTTNLGTTYHYVITVQSNGAGTTTAWYRNGALVGTGTTPFPLSSIEDVNNWLGRSHWSANATSNVAYDEVRLYDHAFSASEAAQSFATGANPTPPATQPDAATMHHGQKVRVNVTANDPGTGTLQIVTPPAHGTAVISGGQILYTHTTGTPATDSFTYRLQGPLVSSVETTVNITFSSSLRITNSSLNVPATPPTTTYTTTPAFGGMTFNNPVNLATVPGDAQRLFVVELGGVIRLIPNVGAASPSSQVFLNLANLCASRGEVLRTDVNRGLMSMAFHPQHAVNRRFFVWYSVEAGGQTYYRVSRFEVQAGNVNAANTASEVVLIQQIDQNGYHLGGDMHFGNDGYLYVSSGDGGGQYDSRRYGQRIDLDFFCGMMRLDVDKLPGNPEPNVHASVPRDGGIARYSVPAGNPFVTANPNVVFNGVSIPATNVRTEFYAAGLRNTFRFSVDALTGEIWAGDVGQDARDEVNLITNGGNYGWSWREGSIAGPNAAEALPGFMHVPPLYDYALGSGEYQGHSVTGGIVYRGTGLPDLMGAYIFGDYVDGHLWALRRNGAQVNVQRLTGNAGIVAFHADPSNGDVLMVDYDEDRILRLVTGAGGGNYPGTLSDTGLFADVSDLSPAPGVLPYTPNLSFWSDHAIKRRWFIIPDSADMTWTEEGAWTCPEGTIWVKHFDLETTRGNPATARRIETRLLVKNAAGAYGVSYRWNAQQTEAHLVSDAGEAFDIEVTEGGVPRIQHYSIPSRAQCLACHTPQAGHALSFNTRQMNREATIHGHSGNQIDLLRLAGYFTNTPASPNVLPRHVRADESAYSLESRARSYIAVNCASCHFTGGTAPGNWDARAHLTLTQTSMLNGLAVQSGGDPLNRLIVPGDTAHSIILSRLAVTNGFTRMPPIGSHELDQGGITLLTNLINQLATRQTYDSWRQANFGNDPNAAAHLDFDGDGRSNEDEYLLGDLFAPQSSVSGGQATFSFTLPPNRAFQIQTSTDLLNWQHWNVTGNQGLPSSNTQTIFQAPLSEAQRFFRVLVREE
jgi:uncharacterized repeat protein (TIGR03806 family)